MKLKQWLPNLGEGVCEIECEQCKRPFYFDTRNTYHHGICVCPGCGNKYRLKDVTGLYFLKMEYPGFSGANWKCGRCGTEFVFHDGQTEDVIECPNCHNRKEKENE